MRISGNCAIPPGQCASEAPHSPSLVQVDQEHHIVPETGQAMGGGHGDDEGEDVINEGVERLWVGWERGRVRNGPSGSPGNPLPTK